MAIISKPYTFSTGAVIIAAEHNSNFDTVYALVNGSLDNSNISGTAAIAYSKLDLTGSIINGDINASAGIVASKLDLTSPGAIGSSSPNTGAFTTLKVGTTHQGDILYDNGTSLVRLTPGTSGYFLQTQGVGANPQWAANVVPYLGSWTSATSDGAGHQVTTDGFLVIECTGSGIQAYTASILTDSSSTPTTVRTRCNGGTTSTSKFSGCMSPVKKNDYYLISEASGTATINAYFISLGT